MMEAWGKWIPAVAGRLWMGGVCGWKLFLCLLSVAMVLGVKTEVQCDQCLRERCVRG